MPPQEQLSMEDEQEAEEAESILRMVAIAARTRTSQQDSDAFKERIKSGLKEFDTRKKQLEQSASAKVKEAKEKLLRSTIVGACQSRILPSVPKPCVTSPHV
jgi:hypothetical protein